MKDPIARMDVLSKFRTVDERDDRRQARSGLGVPEYLDWDGKARATSMTTYICTFDRRLFSELEVPRDHPRRAGASLRTKYFVVVWWYLSAAVPIFRPLMISILVPPICSGAYLLSWPLISLARW